MHFPIDKEKIPICLRRLSDSIMAPFWAYMHTKRNEEVEFIYESTINFVACVIYFISNSRYNLFIEEKM